MATLDLDNFYNLFLNNEKRNNKLVDKMNKKQPIMDDNTKTKIYKEFTESKQFHLIHVNPNVYLAQRGARICIGKDSMNDTYMQQAKYVSKVLTRGHESVSEHANAIGILKIFKSHITEHLEDYTEFLSNMHYNHFCTKEDSDLVYILLGGSPRAFIHLVRECKFDNFFITEYLKAFLYSSFEKELMIPLIELGFMEADKFQYYPDGEITEVEDKVTQVRKYKDEDIDVENTALDCESVFEPEELDEEHVTLIYKSPIKKIYNKVKDYGFTLKDVYKVATVTFIFHDISRTCSHQLVRHRVGISQESQRYVAHEYDKKRDFVNPIKMNYLDRYADSKFDSLIRKLDESNPFKTYSYLIANKVFKEDARAWLPSNVTTQLMMTFTYWQYAHFLYFRLDKAAQKEIREYCANESSSFLFDNPEDRQKFIDICMTYDKVEIANREDELATILTDDDIDEELSAEDIKSLEINNEEDAKKIIEESERLSKL